MALVEPNTAETGTKPDISFSEYLIQEKFLLTALEYHFELLERGISSKPLEEFFSNPQNFYQLDDSKVENLSLNSHMSISTLDSFDHRTGSDDQNFVEEQIKVLEFELRKKNEEIRSLRERLTNATIGVKGGEKQESPKANTRPLTFSDFTEPASNIEARALRFLVNEHLLNIGYKLTAVQFAEECEVEDQQDLDDWDDVGLTCERPPNLLVLLRAAWQIPRQPALQTRKPFPSTILSRPDSSTSASTANSYATAKSLVDQSIQTELLVEALTEELENSRKALSTLRGNFDAAKAELEKSRQQVSDLRAKVTRIEAENLSLAQESTYWRNQLLCLKRDYPDLVGTTAKKPVKDVTIPAAEASNGITSEAKENGENASQDEETTENALNTSTQPEGKAPLPKLVINKPQYTRRCAPEFVRCASELLPSRSAEGVPLEACRLADNLDEIIITIGSQIQDILKHLPDNRKALALPLLVQAICLHPEAEFRYHLLQSLFNLFENPPDPSDALTEEAKRTVVILRQCRDLATCLGPQRIESELLPQIWSQLNDRPKESLRKLLISACCVIAPATPSRLRSSLLLSILLQCLQDEKADVVRAVTLRSLAGVVVLMEDRDKVPLLVSTLESCLQKDWGCAGPLAGPLPCPGTLIGGGGSGVATPATLTALCDWLLPTVAQWCLEVEVLIERMLDPWMEKLKQLCFDSDPSKSRVVNPSIVCEMPPLRLKSSYSVGDLFCIMTVLNRLVPFVFAFVLQSLHSLQSVSLTEDADELVLEEVEGTDEANGGDGEEKGCVKKAAEKPAVEKNPVDDLDHYDRLFSPQYILGRSQYESLRSSFDRILSGSKGSNHTPKKVPSSGDSSLNDETSNSVDDDEDETSADDGQPSQVLSASLNGVEWPAMDVVKSHLMSIAQMMRAISPRPRGKVSVETLEGGGENHAYLEHDAISPQEFLHLMQIQFDDTYWSPWRLPSNSVALTLCKELCHYVSIYGRAFGALAVQNHLARPFHTLLMERSTQGYFEFDLKALPSGVFAGYCCLLVSTKSKTDFNMVKMLIANAIFLHSRDSCSLHGVRAAIMALCNGEDALLVAHKVVLPALRSCASCADPLVRRCAANIFYTLVAYLTDAVDFYVTNTARTTSVAPANGLQAAARIGEKAPVKRQHQRTASWQTATPSLLEECWQLANQLARDDYTSIGTAATPLANSISTTEASPIIDEHTADWSCIAVALGPLLCLYGRMIRSSSAYDTEADQRARRNLADQALVLIDRLMSMVSVDEQTTLDLAVVQFLTQREHWETLVSGLLQVANRLFHVSPAEFTENKILPWLYRLTEINNMIPDSEQRKRLGRLLFSVFSTATYCQSSEYGMNTWLIPGVDRLRLDFEETGEKACSEELKLLASDLRQRFASQSSPQATSTTPSHLADGTTKKRLRQKFSNLLNSADSQIAQGKKFPFLKHS